MTITISIESDSIRHDFDRGGVNFVFNDGIGRHRVHVPEEAIADHLRARALAPAQAEGFIRTHALKLALVLAGRIGGRSSNREILVDLDMLRQMK